MSNKQLRALAEAATQQEWLFHEHGVGEFVIYVKTAASEPAICVSDVGIRVEFQDMQQQERDLKYIAAAQPSAVIALIDRIAQLETELFDVQCELREAVE